MISWSNVLFEDSSILPIPKPNTGTVSSFNQTCPNVNVFQCLHNDIGNNLLLTNVGTFNMLRDNGARGGWHRPPSHMKPSVPPWAMPIRPQHASSTSQLASPLLASPLSTTSDTMARVHCLPCARDTWPASAIIPYH